MLSQKGVNSRKASSPDFLGLRMSPELSASSRESSIRNMIARKHVQTQFSLNLTDLTMEQDYAAPSMSARRQQHFKIQANLISQVTEFLYLSGIDPTSDLELLRASGITHVLNLCGDVCDDPAYKTICKTEIMLLQDTSSEMISEVFLEAFAFIDDARDTGGKVLVHCHQGVSRSATVAIAYLMQCNDMQFLEAYTYVRCCRNIISPNVGFIFQLVRFWNQSHSAPARRNKMRDIKAARAVQLLQMHVDPNDKAITDMAASAFAQCMMHDEDEDEDSVPTVFNYNATKCRFIQTQQEYVASPVPIQIVSCPDTGVVIFSKGPGGQYSKQLIDATRHAVELIQRYENYDAVVAECSLSSSNPVFPEWPQVSATDVKVTTILSKLGVIGQRLSGSGELSGTDVIENNAHGKFESEQTTFSNLTNVMFAPKVPQE